MYHSCWNPGGNGSIIVTQLTCCRYKQDEDGFFHLQTVQPETVEVTQKEMVSQSGATQPLYGTSHTVSGDKDDPLTQEAAWGMILLPLVELDGSGNVVCSGEEMETAELPVLPPAYVTVLHDGSETELTADIL
jgi:hypothetical protein